MRLQNEAANFIIKTADAIIILCRGTGEEEDNNTNNNDDDRNGEKIGDQNNEAPGNSIRHDGDENDPDNAMENAKYREGHIILTDGDVTKRLAHFSSKHGLTQEALRYISELFNQKDEEFLVTLGQFFVQTLRQFFEIRTSFT